MTRDYYYTVDTNGNLWLDSVLQDDPNFLDYFFRRIAPVATDHYPDFPYVSRCGNEMNYVRPADTPIVFNRFDGTKLYYAGSLNVMFRPDKLYYTGDGVLYHAAPVGGVGRLVPQIAMDLAGNIEPWGPWYAYRKNDRCVVPILRLDQADNYTVLWPKDESQCIACGGNNPHGFGLTFFFDTYAGEVFSFVCPTVRMQGSLNIVHGGFVSLLLDETMGKCLSVQGVRAPTAQLNVRFHKPMLIGTEYRLRARITEQRGRKNLVHGEIRLGDDPSVLIAEASALFITLQN